MNSLIGLALVKDADWLGVRGRNEENVEGCELQKFSLMKDVSCMYIEVGVISYKTLKY
jgi:hypothetical protein